MKSLSVIAKELGVSVATVSYVYNNKWRENRIHPDLAERVQQKLDEERGAPNLLGRQLQSGRTQTVGLLLPHLDQPYFLRLLAGIERRLGESDYMVLLGIAHTKRQVELVERMLARQVDAMLVCPRPSEDLARFLTSAATTHTQPLLFVDNYLAGSTLPYVVSDNRWGARQVVQVMLDRGCRRILFVGGNSAVQALQDRYAGYRDALSVAGIACDDDLIVWRDAGDEAALDHTRQVLCGDNRPDAIFATSYFQFFPFLELLGTMGLSHPRDILLGGFDEPMESWTADVVQEVIRQPLLVVRQNTEEMGSVAVDLLISGLAGADTARQERLIPPVLNWSG